MSKTFFDMNSANTFNLFAWAGFYNYPTTTLPEWPPWLTAPVHYQAPWVHKPSEEEKVATKELDRWLLKQSPYPEPVLTEAGQKAFKDAAEETVRNANTSQLTIKSVQAIVCNTCGARADRVGAQDNCDVYVCPGGHITRLLVGKHQRVEW